MIVLKLTGALVDYRRQKRSAFL